MNIGKFRRWLKLQPRDRVIMDLDNRIALECTARMYPELGVFAGYLISPAIMDIDPDRKP